MSIGETGGVSCDVGGGERERCGEGDRGWDRGINTPLGLGRVALGWETATLFPELAVSRVWRYGRRFLRAARWIRAQSRGSRIACSAGEVEASWWGLDGVGVVGHFEEYG